MKAQVLAIAVVIAIFSGASRADSCAAGLFSSLIGTSCTIGDKAFTFSTNYKSFNGPILATLTFAPLVSSSSAGFEIAGFPATSGSQTYEFYDYFTAVPSSGMTITSFSSTLNGVSQTTDGSAQAQLGDFRNDDAANLYQGGVETYNLLGGPRPAGFGTGHDGGFFLVYNASHAGSASFTTADFVFNQSPKTATTPEPSTWMTLGTGLLGLVGVMRKRLLSAR